MKKSLLLTLIIPCLALGAEAHPNAGNGETNSWFTKSNTIKAIKSTQTIKGTVKDAKGEPLIGVNISIKGTHNGTQSDVNGNFTLQANIGDVLVISYVGYVKQEITITGTAPLNISLAEDASQLQEVVVTALGVKRSEKSLVYANQVVGGNELTDVKTDNLMNSLNGKVAGVDISPSSSGVGGSVK